MSDWRRYWVGFNLVRGIGAVRLRGLLDHFGDARSAWEAPPSALRDAGLGDRLIERLVRLRTDLDLEAVWSSIVRRGISVLTWRDEGYPPRLKEIDHPPPVLYLLGDIRPEDSWAVAVVGTRRVSAYGRRVAEELAGELARHRVTVVSGLARGVDTLAHQAALQAGGRTLAVLGSGVDQVYPPENRRLAEAIQVRGSLISDYAPRTAPEASNFPPRNRIIAGLSRAVVVVEAGARSGALITANFAVEQGRDVLAVPGNIYSPGSQGCNALIAQGAQPLLSPQDVLEALDLDRVAEHRTARQALPGDARETKIYQVVGFEPIHIDEISVMSGLPVEQVSASLSMMELKGLVGKVEGMRYVRMRESGRAYLAERTS